MQHNFFDVTLKFTVLQRHFHKFCDTPSRYKQVLVCIEKGRGIELSFF